MRILKTKRSFRKEFKRQIRFAIVAAVGFTVAYAWRDAIYNGFYSVLEEFLSQTQTPITHVYTALFITVLGVLVILITSRILKD